VTVRRNPPASGLGEILAPGGKGVSWLPYSICTTPWYSHASLGTDNSVPQTEYAAAGTDNAAEVREYYTDAGTGNATSATENAEQIADNVSLSTDHAAPGINTTYCPRSECYTRYRQRCTKHR
jgi:hypothetical protein